jgi:hypothetical protein
MVTTPEIPKYISLYITKYIVELQRNRYRHSLYIMQPSLKYQAGLKDIGGTEELYIIEI